MSAPAIIVLPPNETFGPHAAGAIALIVERFARGVPNTIVLGANRPGPRFPGIAYRGLAHGSRLAYAFAMLATLARLPAAPIEIHQEPRLALLAARCFPRRRVSLFLHNDPTDMRGLRTPRARLAAARRLARIVFVSNHLRARFEAGLSTNVATNLSTLPNPIDLATLPPRAEPRARRILFAGRITRAKGADLFVEACARALPALPGWTATMIGGDRFGPDSPRTQFVAQIESTAAHAGIVTTGYRPHADVLAAMAEAAIVVMPTRMIEGFPMVALEALASGAALIATASGGLPEVAGDCAIYVPQDDPTALAAAIMSLATDETALAARAAAGLAHIRQFDLAAILPRLAGLRATGLRATT